jgi:hypothetical protein
MGRGTHCALSEVGDEPTRPSPCQSGPRSCRCRRPRGANPLFRILRHQHPYCSHAPSVRASDAGIPGLVRDCRGCVDRGGDTVARRCLHRQHRRDDDRRPSRPRADWPYGLFLRARRRGARNKGRGRFRAGPTAYGFACTKRAASATKSRVATTSTPISTAAALLSIRKARCSARSAEVRTS